MILQEAPFTGRIYFVGLDSLDRASLDDAKIELLASADLIVVPAGGAGELLKDVLRRAGLKNSVHTTTEGKQSHSPNSWAYCTVGGVIPEDPTAWELYREFRLKSNVNIITGRPLSFTASRWLETSGRLELTYPEIFQGQRRTLGPHRLLYEITLQDGSWIEGLWCRKHRAAAVGAIKRQYPDVHPLLLMDAGVILKGQEFNNSHLYEVDVGNLCEGSLAELDFPLLYLPPAKIKPDRRWDSVNGGQALSSLIAVVHQLRAPGGCPWDREQTHKTLTPFLLEECHELIDTINDGTAAELKEELGDVLLQVLLHSIIAFEDDEFDVESVIAGLKQKMVFRHPHVFADVEADTEKAVEKNWENLKRKKRQESSEAGALTGVPGTLPSLLQAEKVQRVAAQVGFDWEDISGPKDKLVEELRELLEALNEGKQQDISEEFGDLLFTLVNVGRFLGLSPELLLRQTVEKFRARFSAIENWAERQNRTLQDMSLAEMDEIWEATKQAKPDNS